MIMIHNKIPKLGEPNTSYRRLITAQTSRQSSFKSIVVWSSSIASKVIRLYWLKTSRFNSIDWKRPVVLGLFILVADIDIIHVQLYVREAHALCMHGDNFGDLLGQHGEG